METTNRPAAEVAMEPGIRRNQLYKCEVKVTVTLSKVKVTVTLSKRELS